MLQFFIMENQGALVVKQDNPLFNIFENIILEIIQDIYPRKSARPIHTNGEQAIEMDSVIKLDCSKLVQQKIEQHEKSHRD